ncbi:MAG: hypothetical protein K2X03_30555 [Bryobacteraceae bacterium]|nr:hypothetical protein [Bryobacteraceae bacterium]
MRKTWGLLFLLCLFSSDATAQRRVVVRPARGGRVVVHPGHPLRRPLPAAIVVRPARTRVVVPGALVFLPVAVFAGVAMTLPARDRLVWQDSESFKKSEGWVESNFGVNAKGNALYFDLDGRAELNYADVTFSNGEVQTVDFEEKARAPGTYRLLDFADGRHVQTVKILARARTEHAKLTVYIAK